ncbi:MAG: hypothetical protein JW761_01930 [Prolixibacteraceae bacterium]|nr:hypothetical protein [Prolixibacteraceae bacterium]
MKKLIKNSILFLLPFLVGTAGMFFIPVSKNFSYHFIRGECNNKAAWMYHRMFEDKHNTDIVFSGASQTGSAIDDKYISEKLSAATGTEISAVNFGFCRRGRDIQYVMLKDLFAQKQPKILVIEVAEDEPKKSHPVFPYLAESTDVFGSFVWFNQRFFPGLWKATAVRFEFVKSTLLGEPMSVSESRPSRFGYLSSEQIVSPGMLNENSENWQKRLGKTKPRLLRKSELNYSKHYIEKIVELARKNQCKILFLYLPESGSNLKHPLLMDYYQQFSEVIILPDEIVKNDSNWKDATHFNDSGALKTSEYILSFLSPCLSE